MRKCINEDRFFLRETRMVRNCARLYPRQHPADVVSYLRLGVGMTQEQAAKHLGVSISTLRAWQRPEALHVHILTDLARNTKRENARRTNEKQRERKRAK